MSWVYLIRNGDLYKIGVTSNLKRRMKQLKPSEVIQTLETDRSLNLETELHRKFDRKRLPQTEYFRLSKHEVQAARKTLGWNPPEPEAQPDPKPEAQPKPKPQPVRLSSTPVWVTEPEPETAVIAEEDKITAEAFGVICVLIMLSFALLAGLTNIVELPSWAEVLSSTFGALIILLFTLAAMGFAAASIKYGFKRLWHRLTNQINANQS